MQPAHQEGTLIHPLFDRAERMLNAFAALVKHFGPGCKARGQPFVRLADKLCQRWPREVTILVVDSFDARPINRQQLPAEQIELAAQDDELPEDLPECGMVDPAEIGDGFVVWLQVP
ncbi:hypothetical protein [Agrobacterium tumefaciens]|uniref:hypothetical protein n=1 Tax=Agrobacterium tumefaciens TaxID=358 RepID=UPI003AF9DA1D